MCPAHIVPITLYKVDVVHITQLDKTFQYCMCMLADTQHPNVGTSGTSLKIISCRNPVHEPYLACELCGGGGISGLD